MKLSDYIFTGEGYECDNRDIKCSDCIIFTCEEKLKFRDKDNRFNCKQTRDKIVFSEMIKKWKSK